MVKSYTAILFFFSLTNLVYSQGATFRGHVIHEQTGENIIFGVVEVLEISRKTLTDENGFFAFEDLEKGRYTLRITYLGMDTLEYSFALEPGEIVYRKLILKESGVRLSTVDISARKEIRRNEVRISRLSVSQQELALFPSITGDADLAEYLSFLPGIVQSGDQGGQLFFRGGAPNQNKLLLDGLNIFQAFHSLGYFSVFDTELLRSIDVYTSAFPSEFGSRVSGVVDIKTREGNDSKFSGSITANPFFLKTTLEGPLIKRSGQNSSTSFIASSKYSIIDRVSENLYSHASVNDTTGLPYRFRDSFLKLSHTSNNGSKFSVMAFDFNDEYHDPSSASVDWQTVGGALNFYLIPSYSSTIMEGSIGYMQFNSAILDGTGLPRESGVKDFNVSLKFRNYREKIEWQYGFGLNLNRTDFEFNNPYGLTISQFQNTTELHSFIGINLRLEKLIVESGFRAQYYASPGHLSAEPRMGIKYLLGEDFRLKFGGGWYSQNLIAATTERDVVQLFSGFLTGPEFQIRGVDGQVLDQTIQKAIHWVAGVEWESPGGIHINAEAYRKDFDPIIVLNRNKVSNAETDFFAEVGHAEGVELDVGFESRNFLVRSAYSLSRVRRYDGNQEYPPYFDRLHNLNFLASWSLGEQKFYSVGLRWNFGSGFPFTQTQGFYNLNPFFESTGTAYETDNSDHPGIIYSDDRNGARLPYYHRFDASISRTFSFRKGSELKLSISVTNAYNRMNIFYFDRINYTRVNQLPVMPSLDAKWKF